VHFSATALVFAVLGLWLFPLAAPEEPFQFSHLLEMLGVGLSATFGQFFLTRAFTTGDPAKLSVVSLSQFVFIIVLDVLVLGKSLEPSKLWGIPLILGPTWWLMIQRARVREPVTATDVESKGQSLAAVSPETSLVICVDSGVPDENK
jgi:drug/metabolite transporter (DMT)-like permease